MWRRGRGGLTDLFVSDVPSLDDGKILSVIAEYYATRVSDTKSNKMPENR